MFSQKHFRFLLKTNATWQGFINSSGGYCQNSITVRFRFCTFHQHFHQLLPRCDSKHLFPFLLALIISYRKSRRFYTYTHKLFDCNIASHTFFRTLSDHRNGGIVFNSKTTSACCRVIFHFLQLVIRLSHGKIVLHHVDWHLQQCVLFFVLLL